MSSTACTLSGRAIHVSSKGGKKERPPRPATALKRPARGLRRSHGLGDCSRRRSGAPYASGYHPAEPPFSPPIRRSAPETGPGSSGDQGGIHPHAGPHRGRERDRPEVAALGGGGLGPRHLLEHGRVVGHEIGVGKRALADDEVEVAVPVRAVLNEPALEVRDGLAYLG